MVSEEQSERRYKVKLLDFSYQANFSILEFQYINYSVAAKHRKDAIKKARSRYMSGDKGESTEPLPVLLKIFSVEEDD